MLSPEVIEKVLYQAQSSARHSWEYGTIFNALLDYHNPSYSIFNDPFSSGRLPTLAEHEAPALRYVKPFILTDSEQLCDGNGSSSDPTSLVIPALLLSLSQHQSHNSNDPTNSNPYLPAAHRQITHILTSTPRFPNGAISHRSSHPSLWADFISMVPPSLAYYGVFINDITYVKEAVRQCELYRDVLVDGSGCWKHIKNAEEGLGRKKDDGIWSTGNGWVGMGLARVLGIVRASKFDCEMRREQEVLVGMAKALIDGVMAYDTHTSGLLRNRLDDDTWFGECAGTALLAAAVFRMAVLEPDLFGEKYTTWAVKKTNVVIACVDQDTGIVGPVVNPTSDEQKVPLDGVSPEAQAFVVLMVSAWRDWTNARNKLDAS